MIREPLSDPHKPRKRAYFFCYVAAHPFFRCPGLSLWAEGSREGREAATKGPRQRVALWSVCDPAYWRWGDLVVSAGW